MFSALWEKKKIDSVGMHQSTVDGGKKTNKQRIGLLMKTQGLDFWKVEISQGGRR